MASIYVVIGVILLCFSLRKPYPAGLLVATGWIVFYMESQGVATLAVMITGSTLLADVLVGAIALFGALPVIISTCGASSKRIWKSSPLPWTVMLGYGMALLVALFALEILHDRVYSLVAHTHLPPRSTWPSSRSRKRPPRG